MWICDDNCNTDTVFASIPEELDPDRIGIQVNRKTGEAVCWGDGTRGLSSEQSEMAESDEEPYCKECDNYCDWKDDMNTQLIALCRAYVGLILSSNKLWHQDLLCGCRNAISEATGLSDETVQNHFEWLAAKIRSHEQFNGIDMRMVPPIFNVRELHPDKFDLFDRR